MEVNLNQAGELLQKANKIVLSSHVRPDGDNVGSTLGLYHALKGLNKDVTIILDDDLPDNLGMMKGLDLYTKPEDYSEPIQADILVILDVDKDRIGRVKDVVKAPILNLDHHISNSKTCDYVYLDATAPATCAIVYQLLVEMGIKISKESATCLYTGLASDTGFFKYNAKPLTFEIARDLVVAGADPERISQIFEARTYESVLASGKATETIELVDNGTIAIMLLDKDIVASASNTEGFVNIPRIIRGVDVAIMLKYDSDNRTKVSIRSKQTNVSVIAQRIGGGGHIHAAGAVVNASLADTKKLVLEAIREGMKHNA